MSTSVRSTVGAVLVGAGVAVSVAVWTIHFRRVATHTEAHRAVTRAEMPRLVRLLDGGLDADTPLNVHGNWRGDAPLHLAATHGHVEACRLLLERGADVNLLNGRGETPMTCAAQTNASDVMQLLIEHGATTDSFAIDGDTALVRAAELGMTEAVRVLLDQGVDVDQRSRLERTALIASGDRRSRAETMQALLDAGADVNAVDDLGWTPLLAAAYELRRSPDLQLEKVRMLVERGADATVRQARLGTPLAMAIGSSAEAMRLILDAGADPNVACDGRRPLHIAVDKGTPEMVRLLLDAGADPTAEDLKWSWRPQTATQLAEARIGEEGKAIRKLVEEAVEGWGPADGGDAEEGEG